uniref:Uncharacterized protein n=1 Tax=Lepeophtheirus salmonis TaxID=72036 RepID=A0A0K2UN48_LEPSM
MCYFLQLILVQFGFLPLQRFGFANGVHGGPGDAELLGVH